MAGAAGSPPGLFSLRFWPGVGDSRSARDLCALAFFPDGFLDIVQILHAPSIGLAGTLFELQIVLWEKDARAGVQFELFSRLAGSRRSSRSVESVRNGSFEERKSQRILRIGSSSSLLGQI